MYSIFFCTTILLFEIFARLILETTGNGHFKPEMVISEFSLNAATTFKP